MRKIMFSGSSIAALRITESVATPNIPALAAASGWNGRSKLIVEITAPYVNTLDFAPGTYPFGVILRIGASSLVGGLINSGTAIKTRAPLSIENLGKIYGGGGQGGSGGEVLFRYQENANIRPSGGPGGAGQGFLNSGATTPSAAGTGIAGQYLSYPGAVFGGDTPPWGQAGSGGYGGAWGDQGASGGYATSGGSASYTQYFDPLPPAVAGAYIDGAAYVTWVEIGDRKGRSI